MKKGDHVLTIMFCVLCRPVVSQSYNQERVNLSGPPSSYPQHYGSPPAMSHVTSQMSGMQINSGLPNTAGPGYGTNASNNTSGWIDVVSLACKENRTVFVD